MALLDHQEFLATQAGTDLWTLEPQQTSAIGEGLSRLGEGQFHTDGYHLEHKDSITHLQDFSGRRAAEPPPTLYLSEHRLQLCHQGLTLD